MRVGEIECCLKINLDFAVRFGSTSKLILSIRIALLSSLRDLCPSRSCSIADKWSKFVEQNSQTPTGKHHASKMNLFGLHNSRERRKAISVVRNGGKTSQKVGHIENP
jgi:hypothetical protein